MAVKIYGFLVTSRMENHKYMNNYCTLQLGKLIVFGLVSCCFFYGRSILAQIVPDATLPDNSIVTSEGNAVEISGGTRVGNNLFHSFEQFSVLINHTASFNNISTVENIISRVTGGSISNIDGLIKANNANLFLINPNGIIFGSNAALKIGGSFIASTANSIKFDDGNEFAANNPETPPLLTMTIPVGLQLGEDAGAIINRSQAMLDNLTNIEGQPVGLLVEPGRTLALVGREVRLENGNITAGGGRIEIGSITAPSLVGLKPIDRGWALTYEGVRGFKDIVLQDSTVDVSGVGGGEIQLQGKNVILNNSFIDSFTLGNENGGNIIIKSSQLLLENSSSVTSTTFGEGRGGNLFVTASESIQVIGKGGFLTKTFSTGNAGDLNIETGQLILKNGGQVSASTEGNGNGGNVTVNALEFVAVIGREADGDPVSGLFAQVIDSRGNAGSLTLRTRQLRIEDGAQITLSSFEGQAGNINIITGSLSMDQGKIAAETRGNPLQTGANINLQVSDLLLLENESQISATAFNEANGGNIDIDTRYLIALPSKGFGGSDIIANAIGGNGGNINITAQRILGIESRSQQTPFNDITVSSEFGTDGVIEINTPEFEPAREELPANLVDVSRIIEQNLCQAGRGSQFTVTGRGGLPNSPNEAFSANETWEDWRVAEASQRTVKLQSTVNRQQAIVEAQGWVVNSQGKVVLTAEPIATVPHTPILTQSGCR
jgi:filamentous hemagglutinin family protein